MHERRYGGVAVLVGCATLACTVWSGQVLAQAASSGAPDGAPAVVDRPLARAGTTTAATGGGSDESLTVLGHHSRFQPAPMPGAPMGPPPDKPQPHLGRYKITGDQTKKDGYDTQTGAYIAPFGTAYTGAGPVADGLASRFGH